MSSYAPASPSPLVPRPEKGEPRQESFMERWLIMPKLLYFTLNVFVYALHAPLAFIFTEKWNLPYHIYAYATCIQITNFFGSMLWTSLADRTGRYKSILIVTSTLYTLVAIGICLHNPEVGPDGPGLLDYSTIFIGYGLFNFFLSSAFPLLDAQILGMMAKNPRLTKEQFNYQRMYGALGHFVSTLVGMTVMKNYVYGSLVFTAITSVIFIFLVLIGVSEVTPVKGGHHGHQSPAPTSKEASKVPCSEKVHQIPIVDAPPIPPTPAPPSAADELAAEGTAGEKHPVITLLTNPSFLFFMLFITCSGVIRSITSSFQKLIGVQMASDDKVKAAWLDFGRMLSEIIVYIVAKPLKNMMGVYWILVLSQLTGIVRVLGYGYISTKWEYAYWFAAGLELIKGFSSGLVSSSAIPIASRTAPAGCENTAQGLFAGNYNGLSMALGGLIAGIVLHILFDSNFVDHQALNTQKMFQWVAWACLAVTMLMTLKFIFIDRVMGLPGFPRKHSLAK